MGPVDKPAIRCVGAIVHDADGRLLLVRRAHEPGRGRWSVPGGRVEAEESDVEAVIREVGEETGLVVRITRLCGIVTRPARHGEFVICDYQCEVVSGTARAASDASDLAWVDAAGFAELERSGRLVDQLAEALRGWQVLPR